MCTPWAVAPRLAALGPGPEPARGPGTARLAARLVGWSAEPAVSAADLAVGSVVVVVAVVVAAAAAVASGCIAFGRR